MKANHRPCVSVVMSVYNCAKYIQGSIESIIKQTFTDWEFVIIDDGSNDGTSMLLERFCNDPRIKVIRQDNLGLTKSLNIGLKIAQGKYIARQDADDVSFPARIAKQVDFLDSKPDFGLVGTWAEWTDENDTCLQILDYPTMDNDIQETLMKKCCFTHGSVVMRKSAVDDVGGYCEDFFLAQDYDLWLRIAEKFKVANLSEVLYKYRKVKEGISCQMYLKRQKYKQIALERAQIRRRGD